MLKQGLETPETTEWDKLYFFLCWAKWEIFQFGMLLWISVRYTKKGRIKTLIHSYVEESLWETKYKPELKRTVDN